MLNKTFIIPITSLKNYDLILISTSKSKNRKIIPIEALNYLMIYIKLIYQTYYSQCSTAHAITIYIWWCVGQ